MKRACSMIEGLVLLTTFIILLAMAVVAWTRAANTTPNPGLVADDAGDDDSAEEIKDVHP
tara:strand:+ start:747 stop:926 length:180 start_codon:yes stop_codon:yes gene_type:complete